MTTSTATATLAPGMRPNKSKVSQGGHWYYVHYDLVGGAKVNHSVHTTSDYTEVTNSLPKFILDRIVAKA